MLAANHHSLIASRISYCGVMRYLVSSRFHHPARRDVDSSGTQADDFMRHHRLPRQLPRSLVGLS